MKVIDKQLLFISSDERDNGSISDFTVMEKISFEFCFLRKEQIIPDEDITDD